MEQGSDARSRAPHTALVEGRGELRLGARKRFFSSRWLGIGTGSQGSGHGTKLPGSKKYFDNDLRNMV